MWNQYYYYFDLPKIRVGQARTTKIKLPSRYYKKDRILAYLPKNF